MATSIAFDTCAFVKKLTSAGMPEEQARIYVSVDLSSSVSVSLGLY